MKIERNKVASKPLSREINADFHIPQGKGKS